MRKDKRYCKDTRGTKYTCNNGCFLTLQAKCKKNSTLAVQSRCYRRRTNKQTSNENL